MICWSCEGLSFDGGEESLKNKRGLENLGNFCFRAFDIVLVLYPTVRLFQYFQSQRVIS